MLFDYTPEMNDTSFNIHDYLPAFAQTTEWSEIGLALQQALLGTYQSIRLWIVFLMLVSIPIFKMCIAITESLLPHCTTGAAYVIEYIYNMDPMHQVILAIVVVLIIVCYRQGYVGKVKRAYLILVRNTKRRYRLFLESLSESSRMVMQVLPHLLYFITIYLMLVWSPSIVLDMWNHESLTIVLTLLVPLVQSVRSIRKRRLRELQLADESAKTAVRRKSTMASDTEQKSYEVCLQFWTLWSITVCVYSLVSLFVPGFIIGYLLIPRYWCNIVLLWIHFPLTQGHKTLYSWLGPLVNPYANRIKDASDTNRNPSEDEATNFMMRGLVAFGIVKERHMHFFRDLWSQGPALIGLMFIFTPGFVTARGALLVGFGFPAYITMGSLAEKRTRNYEWWLVYFIVAVVVDYLFTQVGSALPWMPFFYHVKLIVILWLQFPYFRGAKTIFEQFFSSVFRPSIEFKE